jgi:kynureninase
VNTPLHDAERGGAVIIDVPNGAAVADELIRREVIVDYRPGAGIRMAPHFYNTMAEIEHAMSVLGEIVQANGAERAAEGERSDVSVAGRRGPRRSGMPHAR